MKHQAMLIKSTKCFYLCGRSLIKCFNNGIDKVQYPNMGFTNFWSVQVVTTKNFHMGLFISFCTPEYLVRKHNDNLNE